MAIYPPLLVFPFAMALAGIMDLITFKIPNWISTGLAVGFFVSAIASNASWSFFLVHFGAGLLTLAVGFVMFARGWLGGGDAKLMSAAALWLGFESMPLFLLWTAMLGGILAFMLLVYRRTLPPVWLVRHPWAMRLHNPKEGIPYGIALAGAGLIVFPQTIWMIGVPS
jgi:prepilin peptidase CpaA